MGLSLAPVPAIVVIHIFGGFFVSVKKDDQLTNLKAGEENEGICYFPVSL